MTLKLRNATPADREALAALAAQHPDVPLPEDLFAFPTLEVAVVEREDGTLVGFGYVEAIPEAHFVFDRAGTSGEERREGMLAFKFAAERVLEALRLPLLRLPAHPALWKMVEWAKELPGISTDPRIHLLLYRPKGGAS